MSQYPTGRHWTQRHRCWLAGQTFPEQAHGIVSQDYLETVWTSQDRRDALVKRITSMMEIWSLGPLVEALRGLRGMDMISAATQLREGMNKQILSSIVKKPGT